MQSRVPREPGSFNREQAEKAALNVLNRRAVSSGLLIDKLMRRGAAADVAREVADHFIEIGAVDDRAYADMVIRSVTRGKPAGATFLRQRLRRDKLAAEIIDAAVDAHLAEHDTEEEAIRWACRRAAALARLEPEKARRRLFGQLARRGLDSDTCRRAVAAALGEEAL